VRHWCSRIRRNRVSFRSVFAYSNWLDRVSRILLCPALGGIKRWCCLASVCLSVWRLSVAYIGPKSRTARPRKTKISTVVAHITRDSGTSFKVKRSTCRGRGYIVAASRTACYTVNMCRLTQFRLISLDESRCSVSDNDVKPVDGRYSCVTDIWVVSLQVAVALFGNMC